MHLVLILVTLTVVANGGTVRKTRAACNQAMAEMDKCNQRAYATYQQAYAAGDDGRPNWMARKSCNYMTSTVDHCTNMLLGECYTWEEVVEMKDQQFKGIIQQLETSIDDWNSDMCPPVRAHIKRMNGEVEGVEEIPEEQEETCSEVQANFKKCTRLAFRGYQDAFAKGNDGRPDWVARKSCNYMTAAVEDCGNNMIGQCNTEEEVTEMKDYQFQGILNQLATGVHEWDSEKCPVVKSHIERMREEVEVLSELSKDDILPLTVFSYILDTLSFLID